MLPSVTPTEDLMSRCTPEFISELAAQINEPADILNRHGITGQELGVLKDIPAFKNAYREAKAFWNSDANFKERIAVKAGTLVEGTMLDVYTIIKDADANIASRLDAFKTLASMAGTDGKHKEAAATGQRVSVNITLGKETVTEREVNVKATQAIEPEAAEA